MKTDTKGSPAGRPVRNQNRLLEVKNLTKVFGHGIGRGHETIALQDFSLTLYDDQPKITAIAGESGSGKTTLARLILDFIKPTSGEILWRGRNLHKMSKKELMSYRHECQAVFPGPVRRVQPVLPGRSHISHGDNRVQAGAQQGRSCPDRGRCTRSGRPESAGDPWQVPAPALRRAATAAHRCAGLPAQAAADRGRRAGVDDRCLTASHDSRYHAQAEGRVRDQLSLHYPRSLHRVSDQRPHLHTV